MSDEITEEEQQRYLELQRMALDFARNGETDELNRMLEAGMPPDLYDEKGQSLLMLASYNGHEETTRMLLAHGAEVDRRNDRGQTPLGGVAFKGYVSVAKLLIEAGADIHANNGGGMTPLHYATMFGRWEVARLLETHGATLNRESPDTLDTQDGLFSRLIRKLVELRGRFRSRNR